MSPGFTIFEELSKLKKHDLTAFLGGFFCFLGKKVVSLQKFSKNISYNMSGIHVFNVKNETNSDKKNVFMIHRPNILGNPYTHITDRKTLAEFKVRNREEALYRYDHYFDIMYSGNGMFRKEIDKIYECYKSGEDVYLGCYCHPERCHGDIIAEKLQKRLLKDKIRKIKDENNLQRKMA